MKLAETELAAIVVVVVVVVVLLLLLLAVDVVVLTAPADSSEETTAAGWGPVWAAVAGVDAGGMELARPARVAAAAVTADAASIGV